ncbi:MAG: hypothetical protein JWP26_2616 [Devosia sp.]|uniref:hypothetical protein n=1 Tax=Devosia sp. TaxID=1871048 RepID=UPI0026050C5C|nr:hypothetical protein [Devosia sp.]MDB5587646.1 hypothetical protein [Devosia sp.]
MARPPAETPAARAARLALISLPAFGIGVALMALGYGNFLAPNLAAIVRWIGGALAAMSFSIGFVAIRTMIAARPQR